VTSFEFKKNLYRSWN